MEFEIGDADYNVVGSLENNEGGVEKYQNKEVLIPMDEEAVKESLVFTTEIKVTKANNFAESYEKIQLKSILMIILNTSAWNSLPKILVLVQSKYNYNSR